MGYINDTVNPPAPYSCHELYKWLLRVAPKFSTDDEMCSLVKDEEPDVEQWQYMGRRYFSKPNVQYTRTPRETVDYSPPRRGKVHNHTDAEVIQFSFATQPLRDRVRDRLVAEGYKVTDTWSEVQ